GKTNVPSLLADWQSFNSIYGTTCNPWDTTRTPGGSSGGAAAALATGLTPLELGSDIGASVRNPAHYCGVYGHKTSFGNVPQAGQPLPTAEGPLDILVCGPLARSPTDLAKALQIIVGPEPENLPYWAVSLPEPRIRSLKDARIAVWLEDPVCKVDNTVQDLIRAVVTAASNAGAVVDDSVRPAFDSAEEHSLYLQLLRGTTGAILSDEAFERQIQQLQGLSDQDDSYLARTLRGVAQSHRNWFLAHQRRAQLRRKWQEFFENFDIILCPTAATAAFPHDQKR